MPELLKSLELQGYKTFASRSLFEFAGAITAIIGPNGSGKSNIADSIRWVLGEQSYSLLRGRKTEDMIFSGSEQRPRAGMASATVVFDNSSGWLPIDFSEVAVTRRAYRDGQNEYMINGQRVRLRDVSELLAESGLAERTYTIIGQGVVDAALALKAEERRRLFEEAAGIGLHRSRRVEALRRLDTTQRNLDRVQDIMAELKPRLRSLERQARRAGEYEQVRADLRILLREWYGFYWYRAQRELAEAQEFSRSQEESLAVARQEQVTLDEQIASARANIQGLRARLGSWHRQLAQLHTQREGLSRQLAVSEERSRSLQVQADVLLGDISRILEELNLQEERVSSVSEQVSQLTSERLEAQAQAKDARKSLEERRIQRVEVEDTVQKFRQELSELKARRGEVQARIAERRNQGARRLAILETSDQEILSAENVVVTAKKDLSSTADLLRAAEVSRQEAAQAVAEHEKMIVDLESLRIEHMEQRSARLAEVTRLKTELEVLHQAEDQLTGYASGAKILIQAAREARLTGTKGAFGAQLDVPADMETAIVAALGEYLDAVILEQDSGSEIALDILVGESHRGVLLPLDMLRPGVPLSGMDGIQGVLGLASDFVRAPAELRPAVDLLLGRTLVVRDRQSARQALAYFSDADSSFGGFENIKAVTRRGEVFYANGPITTGRESKGNALSRPRHRKELQEKLDRIEQQVAEMDGQIDEYNERLGLLRSEAEQLADLQQKADQEEEKARENYLQSQLTLQQAERQLGWHREQQDHMLAEIEHGGQEESHLSAELLKIEGDIDRSQENLREALSALGELATDNLRAQVNHWEKVTAVAERALDDARKREEERKTNLAGARESLKNSQSRLAESKQTLETLEGGVTELRRQEGEINEEITSIQTLIAPAEAELETLEKAQEALHAAEVKTRQRLSTAEHNHAQARISLARRQEALETWRRRIEDDFGLVAFEYDDEISGPTPLPLESMVEDLPRTDRLSPGLEDIVKRKKGQMRRMGAVNPEAQKEYQEVKDRFEFMVTQVADLEKAEVDIRQVIAELDAVMEREFLATFEATAEEFSSIFKRLFGGGSARLVLTDPDDPTNTGIDIVARLPGRRSQGLSLLSGGERSLTATALIFALLKISPTPFCLLDEVDAMLDEANVGRFRDLLRELSQNTQFIIVTHNRGTVQAASVIYGITMGRDSASQVISLKLDEVSQVVE
jgi:chromosome segregation protein